MKTPSPKYRLQLRQEQPVSVPAWWLRAAARLPGKALAVGLVMWTHAGACGAASFAVEPARLRAHGVAPDAFYDALTRLAAAQLIAVERGRGRSARVTLLNGAGTIAKIPVSPSGAEVA